MTGATDFGAGVVAGALTMGAATGLATDLTAGLDTGLVAVLGTGFGVVLGALGAGFGTLLAEVFLTADLPATFGAGFLAVFGTALGAGFLATDFAVEPLPPLAVLLATTFALVLAFAVANFNLPKRLAVCTKTSSVPEICSFPEPEKRVSVLESYRAIQCNYFLLIPCLRGLFQPATHANIARPVYVLRHVIAAPQCRNVCVFAIAGLPIPLHWTTSHWCRAWIGNREASHQRSYAIK